jgi:hypothetical protein
MHDVGRARRSACDGAPRRERWRLPREDAPLAERLASLGARGVGGFVDAGVDDEGPWLLRAVPAETLADRMRAAPGAWPWIDAVRLAVALGRALAASEAASLFAGPLLPERVALEDTPAGERRAWLPADGLVAALVGGEAPARPLGDSSPAALLWAPPERAEAPGWDGAANRYALGLILYRLIAGEHAFGGAGLRHGLEEARRGEPPPFADAIAERLPAGLQSLCLGLLAFAPNARPARAAEIVAALERVLAGEASSGDRVVAEPEPAGDKPPPYGGAPQAAGDKPRPYGIDRPWGGRLGAVLGVAPALGGLALIAVAGLAAWGPGGDGTAATAGAASARPAVGAERPLGPTETAAGDCAGCHPRHAAEWGHSVMGHAVKSPLFNALEMLIEEQVGRDRDCPNGAGILRRAPPGRECRDARSGLAVTGSGGEHWCVHCHAPTDTLGGSVPAWEGRADGDPRTRQPVRALIGARALEGISCGFCHQTHGPVGPAGSGGYEGNPTWTSFATGARFLARPEDGRGLFGIANSGYRLDPRELVLLGAGVRGFDPARVVLSGVTSGAPVHARPTEASRRYLASSEFCGSCHDVRLFGTDVLGASERGEHFKRLRNAYSEWASWTEGERRAGRRPASCQDCHMSSFPGVCLSAPGADGDALCPPGSRFEERAPGERPRGLVAAGASEERPIAPHYFTAVDLPLAREVADAAFDRPGLDAYGIPLSSKRRRLALLRQSLRLTLGEARRTGGELEILVEVENVRGGHRIPAGFSQERELWIHLRVEDGAGRVLYEVGRVDRDEDDLRDKIFARVGTDPDVLDAGGRPVGLFGADVVDGPDVPRWSPPPELGGTSFRGRGLINFQNGFLRCVRCLGEIGPDGACLPPPAERHRAERFADGDYDADTGACRSNLSGRAALFETYMPVGALDAERGLVKGPDAIIDTRSLAPHVPVRYTYALDARGRRGPFRVVARLMFRSFPPFLVRAFAEYEAKQAARGRRSTGPLVSFDMLRRLERVEVGSASLVVP